MMAHSRRLVTKWSPGWRLSCYFCGHESHCRRIA